MSRYEITKSLIESWNYCYSCYESVSGEAYQAFLSTLRREPRETSPEAQNGIDFENDVYALVNGFPKSQDTPGWWERGERLVADELIGAELQVKVRRELSCHGMDFLVVGVLDALRAGVIKDVKFSNKGFSSADLQGKYLDCSQHPAYFYLVPEAYRFDYIVSDGEDIYTETYYRETTRPFPEIVEEFMRSLEDMGLMDTYKQYWKIKESNV